MTQNIVKSAAEYVRRITGRNGYFTFLEAGKNRVAVFRRFSFIPPDDASMIRLRLAPEITPKIETSVLNGFLIGEVCVDGKGRITRGLDANRRALLDYLLDEPMGAHVVEKLGTRLFKIHYPGALAEILIARAARMTGAIPVATIRNHCWHIRVGNIGFEVERFLESCLVHTSLDRFCALIKLDKEKRGRFVQIARPCVFVAFGRTVDVAGTMTFAPEKQNQISDRAFIRLFQAYEPTMSPLKLLKEWGTPPPAESIKPLFLSGRHLKLSPRWPLPENTVLPVTSVEIPQVIRPDLVRGGRLQRKFRVPAGPGRDLFMTIARQQYDYLKGCLAPGPVECRLGSQRLVGRVSAVDQTIYPPIWLIDHFFNCFAMLDFDQTLAKEMILGGMIDFMELRGNRKGQLALVRKRDRLTTCYPIWAPLVQRCFARTGDRKFLKQIRPFLQLNDRYLDRHYLQDGIYVDAGGFWNDYSAGPKGQPGVAGIGMNCLIALQKKILFELGAALGVKDERLHNDFENLKARINERFWDDRLGFYFDYDHGRRQIYTTARGGRFFGNDNLLPLLAGIVPEERVGRMARYLTSSRYYGGYPAITTDLSDDFMDERRLMVWVMNNWLLIQGLRNYRLHAIADGIARRILNAFLKIWNRTQALPEALSGPFGLAPMENSTLAGVGCWTGFYLYLQEAFRDRRSTSKGAAS